MFKVLSKGSPAKLFILITGVALVIGGVVGIFLANFAVTTHESSEINPRTVFWRHIHGLGFDPAQRNTLFIATHGDFYWSVNDSPPSKVDEQRADYMAFSAPYSQGVPLYASGHPATGGNTGLIKSTDGGKTWQQVATVLDSPIDFHAMGVTKSDPNLIIGFDSEGRGLFKTVDAGNHSFVFDLGKPVPEPWGLKFKLNILQLNPPSNGMFRCFFGLSSKDQNTPANVQQDFLGLELRLAIVEKYIDKKAHVTSDRGFYYNVPALERTQQYQLAAMDAANETLNKNASVFFSHVLASEALLVEIVRLNEKHYKIDLYSESGVLIESKSIECAVPPRNLRYICGKNQTDTRKGGSISGTISNVKFYNGVTGV